MAKRAGRRPKFRARCKRHSGVLRLSAASAIEVLVATRSKDTGRQGRTRGAHTCEAEGLHQRLHFRSLNGFLGIAAHTVLNVMHEAHPAHAVIVDDIQLKVTTRQEEGSPEKRDVDGTRAPLRFQRRTAIPALFASPKTTHQ